MIKLRIHRWNWKAFIPNVLALILLSLAMGYVMDLSNDLASKKVECNQLIIEGC